MWNEITFSLVFDPLLLRGTWSFSRAVSSGVQIQRSWIPALLAAPRKCFLVAERVLLLDKRLWEFASVPHHVAELTAMLTATTPTPTMRSFPGGSLPGNPPVSAGDAGVVPGRGDPRRRRWRPAPVFLPGEAHGQRAWQATVPGVANQTQLMDWTTKNPS